MVSMLFRSDSNLVTLLGIGSKRDVDENKNTLKHKSTVLTDISPPSTPAIEFIQYFALYNNIIH